ncbi:sporulation histidine kinase inhibitor Sda [Bacillus sp. FJAT-44742]|uniref:sporulation histidine kinase inhibitor Sda n=1 Tax=Bacillus sp. FJAT-44742 TaxID=2014005 RepID=UPI000C249CE0|nr:sporulation histidine kinase inhibitor Sda [Bacillus sp. FJAT-44742]
MHLKEVPTEVLLAAYRSAQHYELDKDFLDILKSHIIEREAEAVTEREEEMSLR